MSELLKVLAVTAEVMGVEWSEGAASMVADELREYPVEAVKVALSRCRKELKCKLTLADILDRIPGGHPGPEEAWSCIAKALREPGTDETSSLVWTEQIAQAYLVARSLSDDPVAARMAFKETYAKLVGEARSRSEAPKWALVLGTDKGMREQVAQDAVDKGRISYDHARKLVPMLPEPAKELLALVKRIG